MTTRESRPHMEAAPKDHGEEVQTSITAVADKSTLTALARRWRTLGLGCPRGCPLDHHEEPCHLARWSR